MQQKPIEGNNESQDESPHRTGDTMPTSSVTPREATTMAAVPVLFIGLAIVVAVVVAVLLFALR